MRRLKPRHAGGLILSEGKLAIETKHQGPERWATLSTNTNRTNTMPKATKTARRRKVICREMKVAIPGEFPKVAALLNLSTPELKNLLRAAKIGIPKDKQTMAERLAVHEAVAVSVTTEAVVFGAPGKARPN